MTLAEVSVGLESETISRLGRIGFSSELDHAATCLIVDQDVSRVRVQSPDVDVMPLAEALQRFDWVQDLMFSLVSPEDNAHIAHLLEGTEPPVGHFVWVHPGAKVRLPIQLFTLLSRPQGRQYLHSITVVGEGADVEIVSGSTVPQNVHAATHVSVSETFLHEGATCRSVSVEQWGDAMRVHDFAGTRLAAGASATATTIQMSHVRHHHSESSAELGRDATSNDQTILFSPEGTERILDSTITLTGDRSRAQSLARMVAAGGTITNRSTLVGDGADTYGYLGCDGLKLDDRGQIHSAPALVAHSASAQLSHEASIGVIGTDKIAYLMASGLGEEEARDLLIQGFLDLDESLVPVAVRAEVADMVATAKSGAL